mgnify:CR=1 FL=1
MLNEAQREKVVSISPEAAKAVQDIITEKKLVNHALRIYVAGSSCSGVQFGMALDDKSLEGDTSIETEGVKIVVDPQSMDYLYGGSIEFVNDPQKGTGFVINAPQANTGNCGCGSNENAEASSCGCGNGGCGCDH